MMYANVVRMIGASAKDAAMTHPLGCDKCISGGMFECPDMLRLMQIAVRADKLREMPRRCEWNPAKHDPAQIDFVGREEHVVYCEGTCLNAAVVSVGEKMTFWICASCLANESRFFGRPWRHLTVDERLPFSNPEYTGI